MKTKKLITCDNSVEADNLMAQLRAEGIECSSYDESLNKAVVGGNVPGIAILIPEDKYEAGMKIVNQMQKEREEFIPWCPKCGSEDIAVEVVSKKYTYRLWMAIALLVLAVVSLCMGYTSVTGWISLLAFISFVNYYQRKPCKCKEYTCRKCGKKFRK